jgi:hypothetical protein
MRAIGRPVKLLCCLLVVAMLAGMIPCRPARAELVATEAVVTPASAPEWNRARLRAWLDRADVRAQLEAYGVGAEEAEARVAALTDDEVARIAGRLDEVPAGGSLETLLGLMVFGAAAVVAFVVVGIGWAIVQGVKAVSRAARHDAGRDSPEAVDPPGSSPPAADLKWPPAGFSYVISESTSGSYGTGTRRVIVRYLGEETWQGARVHAFSEGSVVTYLDDRRRILARVDAKGPIESYEPYFVFADWPISVGKTWPNRYRYYDHARARRFDGVRYDGQVEAYEDVNTPAGTFKAFRIALRGVSSHVALWYSDDLGLVVKTRAVRLASHYLGAGMRETKLVSYDRSE